MLTGNKIPIINQNIKIIDALKILSKKIRSFDNSNKNKKTIGIVTDGQIRNIVKKY